MLPWIAIGILAVAVLALASNARKVGIHMGQLDDKLAALDAATSLVAVELEKLRASLEDVATPEQLAHLDALAASLTAMAAGPNPVPIPVPVA